MELHWRVEAAGLLRAATVLASADARVWRPVGEGTVLELRDPATGQTVWEGAFPKHRSNYYASPLIAGDKLLAPREDGTVFVASVADDKFEVLSENNMEESVIGSPVPATNRILLRGEKNLFCIAAE